jgi:hypothetical protein
LTQRERLESVFGLSSTKSYNCHTTEETTILYYPQSLPRALLRTTTTHTKGLRPGVRNTELTAPESPTYTNTIYVYIQYKQSNIHIHTNNIYIYIYISTILFSHHIHTCNYTVQHTIYLEYQSDSLVVKYTHPVRLTDRL